MHKNYSIAFTVCLPAATSPLSLAPSTLFFTCPPDAFRLFSFHYRSCHSHLPCNRLIPITWAYPPISPPVPHFLNSHSLHILVHFVPLSVRHSFYVVVFPCYSLYHSHSQTYRKQTPGRENCDWKILTSAPIRQNFAACKTWGAERRRHTSAQV